MRSLRLVAGFLVMTTFAVASGKRDWLTRVPEKERVQASPMAGNEDAVAAGAILYQRSCASCHGGDARGVGRRPSLRTERVRGASEGELHWLLTNGSLGQGMPSWSRLPDAQRWQLTRYLHSLDGEGEEARQSGQVAGPL